MDFSFVFLFFVVGFFVLFFFYWKPEKNTSFLAKKVKLQSDDHRKLQRAVPVDWLLSAQNAIMWLEGEQPSEIRIQVLWDVQ